MQYNYKFIPETKYFKCNLKKESPEVGISSIKHKKQEKLTAELLSHQKNIGIFDSKQMAHRTRDSDQKNRSTYFVIFIVKEY